MSNAAYMKELLRPLGVYKLDESFLCAELDCMGLALDSVERELERIQQEMCLTTAREDGLDKTAKLFGLRPVTQNPQQLSDSLSALSRIGWDSFTLSAINNTISGCGVKAEAAETQTPGGVTIRFPNLKGVPPQFESLRTIIEDILPAHLQIQYLFWYMTWGELNARNLIWQDIQNTGMSWEEFETLVG
ncbi:MAG: DUF2313 domain-containing protein [Ruminococcaceae bacterium]|nr:DUF2313 domain-containing protein [Oscillospiraceae bacterium]